MAVEMVPTSSLRTVSNHDTVRLSSCHKAVGGVTVAKWDNIIFLFLLTLFCHSGVPVHLHLQVHFVATT